MTLSEKKDLYKRFLNHELNPDELETFFRLVESGELDNDYQNVMPEMVMADTSLIIRKPMVRLLVRISIAASLFFIAGLSYINYRKAEQVRAETTMVTVAVPTGSMQILTLKDHSVVTLTSGSVFRYPKAFTSGSRKVYLVRGKGFFEVAKDKLRPFTVYATKISTTALGTSFTVENYTRYHLEKVRLYTGKVEIGSNDRSFAAVQLVPGQQYVHNETAGSRSAFDIENNKTHHEDGTLSFEQTALTDALISVASYYNIDIRFNQEMLKRHSISATFHNEPVEDVLRTLLFTHHLKLKKIPGGYAIMK